jgi:flagella basal body P-ring formation protein FlgA
MAPSIGLARASRSPEQRGISASFRGVTRLHARVSCRSNPVTESETMVITLFRRRGEPACTRRSRPSRAVACLVAFALLLAGDAAAQESTVAQRVRLFLAEQSIPGGEVELVVGEPDPRLELAPCNALEPFIPPGARMWGRSSIGVRCLDGARWTVYLPVHVHVYASVLVAARPLRRGETIDADAVRAERVDLTRVGGAVYAADEDVLGRIASRAFAPGEPLRRDAVKAPAAIVSGDPVRIVIDAPGVVVTTEGKALAAAAAGESVRIVTGNGRVLTGIAHAGKVVAIR